MLIMSDFPDPQGIDNFDLTSFEVTQQHWGPDKDVNWPNVLYQFEPPDWSKKARINTKPEIMRW